MIYIKTTLKHKLKNNDYSMLQLANKLAYSQEWNENKQALVIWLRPNASSPKPNFHQYVT